MIAELSFAADKTTPTIVFSNRRRERAGNVSEAFWGFRESCSGTRIGQYVQGRDEFLNSSISN